MDITERLRVLIENDELCIKNDDELCIKNDGLCIKLTGGGAHSHAGEGCRRTVTRPKQRGTATPRVTESVLCNYTPHPINRFRRRKYLINQALACTIVLQLSPNRTTTALEIDFPGCSVREVACGCR